MGKEASGPLGPMEMRLVFEPRAGGEPVETLTTPSMWARADEWLDGYVYESANGAGGELSHSDNWLADKLLGAIQLLAAVDAGLMRRGPVSLERIFEMRNAYDVASPDGQDEGDEGGRPTAGPAE